MAVCKVGPAGHVPAHSPRSVLGSACAERSFARATRLLDRLERSLSNTAVARSMVHARPAPAVSTLEPPLRQSTALAGERHGAWLMQKENFMFYGIGQRIALRSAAVPAAILFAALLAVGDATAAPSQMGPFELGFNYNGGDLFSSVTNDAGTCRALCEKDRRCVAMTFIPDQRRCWIKGRLLDFLPNAGMVAAVKLPPAKAPPPPGAPRMGPPQGFSYPGHDLESRITPRARDCPDVCLGDPRCRAVTYVVSQHRCWVKAAVPGEISPPSRDMVSYEKLD